MSAARSERYTIVRAGNGSFGGYALRGIEDTEALPAESVPSNIGHARLR